MGDLKEKYLQLWGRLTKRQHYMAIGGVVVLVIAIVAASFAFGGKPDMVPLFTNMETKDAGEVYDKSQDKRYARQLTSMRQAMVDYLSERGEEWVRDGKLVKRAKNLLYSPHYKK